MFHDAHGELGMESWRGSDGDADAHPTHHRLPSDLGEAAPTASSVARDGRRSWRL